MPHRCINRKRNHRGWIVVSEALEPRQMLSAAVYAYPADGAPVEPSVGPGVSSPPGLSPTQIRAAYGINNIELGSVAGTGAGQTIAIITAYDNPKFVDSTSSSFDTSDLHEFDVTMGIADPPSFTKVDENGGTNYPTTNSGFANETALDVEWAHAIAPSANIVLVEAASNSLVDLIERAVQYARILPSVSVVTMSFAVPEFSDETSYDLYLETPAGHTGITFLAASGDDGDATQYPASSPNVVSVGATTLTLSGNTYSSESGRNTSGGGVSLYEAKPAYQYAVTQSSTMRTTPDVSIDGDPNTGVSVYDSFNGGSTPWYKIGGTSFGAPGWGGLIAIADQGRAQLDLSTLDGVSQTLPRLYELNSSDYHDVTTGSNGLNAGTGYDLVTGIGTPIASSLVPDLAAGNSVTGTIYNDANGNGTKDSGEAGLSGFSTFLDIYHSGSLQGDDTEVSSGSSGTYDFADLPGGTYRFVPTVVSAYTLTAPTTYYTITLGFNSAITGKNIGYKVTHVPAKVAFSQQPTSANAGTAITPGIVVAVEDSSGNVATTDNSTVTLSVASGPGTLGGTVTETATSGVATFSNISLSAAGSYTLKATDGSLTSATSTTFAIQAVVNTVVATKLVFSQQPTTAAAGTAITPAITVTLEDDNGDVATSDTSAVTLTTVTAAGGGTLGGTLTVDAEAGVATFSNITLSAAGDYALTATDGSLTAATSDDVTITASSSTTTPPVTATAAQLAFVQQPTAVNVSDVIAPPITVDVDDSTGTLVSTDTSAVTLSIATGTGTLGGTLVENAVNGVATFSDITISAAGSFTLAASDSALTAATSSSFAVSPPGVIAAAITHSTLPKTVIAGTALHSVITVNATNTTGAPLTGKVVADIYASLNGVLTLLGSTTRPVLPIKAGKSAPIAVSIKSVPSNLSGTYSIIAEAIDSSGDNLQSVPGASLVISAPLISLSETVTKLTLPASVVAGGTSKAIAVVKITNGGNVISSGATTVAITAVPGGTLADEAGIDSIDPHLVIRPGSSILVTVPLKTIPSSLDGSYGIYAEVTDPNGAVTDASSGKTSIFGPGAVLLTASITAATPATIAPGKSGRFTLVLNNTGNIDTSDTASISVGLSVDGTTEFVALSNLFPVVLVVLGKPKVMQLQFTIPSSVAAGTYFPFVSYTQNGDAVQAVGSKAITIT